MLVMLVVIMLVVIVRWSCLWDEFGNCAKKLVFRAEVKKELVKRKTVEGTND